MKQFLEREVVDTLKNSDADCYLLLRQLSSTENWKKFGRVRYSNNSYVVIEFDRD